MIVIEKEVHMKDRNVSGAAAGGGNAAYILAMIGAAVYYVQQASGGGQIIIGLLKALVWPAFIVHDVLKYIGG